MIFWIVLWAGVWFYLPHNRAPTTGENAGEVIINEMVAANHTGLTDEDGDHSDWIELYNRGRQPVNLAGWFLTDDPAQPQKWPLPGVTLAGRDYLLVFASGKNRASAHPGSELHTNFKLDQQGEFLGLYHLFQDQFIDVVSPASPAEPAPEFPLQLDDIAYGRYQHPGGTSTYGYLESPTPAGPNPATPTWVDLVAPVRFSVERGFYEEPFQLELSTSTPGAIIRYTLDGSTPSSNYSAVYNGSIPITTTSLVRATAFKPNFRPSPVETHSYLFLEAILAQSNTPPGFPPTWGSYKGAPVRADYEMDAEVVNDPRYRGKIKEALQAIPTLSLVTDMAGFYDLYANPTRRGRAWERPVSVELIDPNKLHQGFQINAGIRIHGELGRSEYMPKHAFRLFFRKTYGPAKLEYALFPDSPLTEFDSLVLRGGVNRSYAGYPGRKDELRLTTYTRDEWLRASQQAMSGYGVRGSFVHLYLNGLYWGLYNAVERPDAALLAAYFGGPDETWQIIDHDQTLDNSSRRFTTLHQLAKAGGLADPEKYAAIQAYLDIPHFIDYVILNWYSGNLDWGFNNWYAGVEQSQGQVRYFVWDGERTWFDGAEIYMEMDEYRRQPNLVKFLLAALMENPDFRMTLADRLYRHLFHEGALAETEAQARWLALNQVIEPAIIGESARWGDTRFETPLTQADWIAARDKVLAQMAGNGPKLISLAREAGYYPGLDPPEFNQRGGQIAPGFNLTLASPSTREGLIFYTTDGSDPRLAGTGAVAPAAAIYRTPLVLTGPTQIKARLFSAGTWSALNEAIFYTEAETACSLQITEIMYNPLGGDDYEFIELKNRGGISLNLAGMSFEGIRFVFPAGDFWLPPGQVIVLVRNPETFARRYPTIPIAGVYTGQLSNKGETIRLKDAQDQMIISVTYDDEHGWPISPDGHGDSLILVDPGHDAGRPARWQASVQPNGSPGEHEP